MLAAIKKLSWGVLTPLLTPKLKALTSLKHLKHLSNKVVLNVGRGEEDYTLEITRCLVFTVLLLTYYYLPFVTKVTDARGIGPGFGQYSHSNITVDNTSASPWSVPPSNA